MSHKPIYGAGTIIFGAGILMWATFAIRGWEIQSIDGNTLGERVNQWIFRTLFIIGTAVVIVGTCLTV